MNSQNSNPFLLPGFGQTGEHSQNPLLASMEMMRQAWQGLASSGVLAQPPIPAGLTTEDLDRRISDLRAVENWLRLNMSMLSSSIQALEVQRATIATLKSFANVPGAPADNGDNPSPLEVALGIKPSGQAKIKTPTQAPSSTAASEDTAAGSAQSGTDSSAGAGFQPDPAALTGAAQDWWNMLQKQFDTVAAATVAGMQGVQAATDPASKRAGTRGAASGKSAAKRARTAAADASASGPERTTARKAAVKKKAARTARKTTAR